MRDSRAAGEDDATVPAECPSIELKADPPIWKEEIPPTMFVVSTPHSRPKRTVPIPNWRFIEWTEEPLTGDLTGTVLQVSASGVERSASLHSCTPNDESDPRDWPTHPFGSEPVGPINNSTSYEFITQWRNCTPDGTAELELLDSESLENTWNLGRFYATRTMVYRLPGELVCATQQGDGDHLQGEDTYFIAIRSGSERTRCVRIDRAGDSTHVIDEPIWLFEAWHGDLSSLWLGDVRTPWAIVSIAKADYTSRSHHVFIDETSFFSESIEFETGWDRIQALRYVSEKDQYLVAGLSYKGTFPFRQSGDASLILVDRNGENTVIEENTDIRQTGSVRHMNLKSGLIMTAHVNGVSYRTTAYDEKSGRLTELSTNTLGVDAVGAANVGEMRPQAILSEITSGTPPCSTASYLIDATTAELSSANLVTCHTEERVAFLAGRSPSDVFLVREHGEKSPNESGCVTDFVGDPKEVFLLSPNLQSAEPLIVGVHSDKLRGMLDFDRLGSAVDIILSFGASDGAVGTSHLFTYKRQSSGVVVHHPMEFDSIFSQNRECIGVIKGADTLHFLCATE